MLWGYHKILERTDPRFNPGKPSLTRGDIILGTCSCSDTLTHAKHPSRSIWLHSALVLWGCSTSWFWSWFICQAPISLWLESVGYRYVPARIDRLISNGVDSVSTIQPTLEEALVVHIPQVPLYQHPEIFFGYLNAVSSRSLISRIGMNLINLSRSNLSPPRVPKLRWYFTSTLVRNLIVDGVADDSYVRITACVVNFITHEKAYSLYPWHATFEKRCSLAFRFKRTARTEAYRKYAKRGWKILDGITGNEFHDLNSSVPCGPRHVGDSKTWTIPILPKIDASFPEGLNSWSLRYDEDLKPLHKFSLLPSPRLQYYRVIH